MRRPQTDEEGMIASETGRAFANKSSLYVIDMKPEALKEDKTRPREVPGQPHADARWRDHGVHV
jgi:hypothetical protein